MIKKENPIITTKQKIKMFLTLTVALTIFIALSNGYSNSLDKQHELKLEIHNLKTENLQLQSEYEYVCFLLNQQEIDNLKMSMHDLLLLLEICEAETTGHEEDSKIAVTNVILNRMKSTQFPNTLYEVIYQKNPVQFTPTVDGRLGTLKITQTTIDGVFKALIGVNNIEDSLYFANEKLDEPENYAWFKTLEYVTEISCHEFYK